MEPSNRAVDDFTSRYQLTKSIHWDLYPALDPNNPDLSASGKVVLFACNGSPIGTVSASQTFYTINACCCPLVAMAMQFRLMYIPSIEPLIILSHQEVDSFIKLIFIRIVPQLGSRQEQLQLLSFAAMYCRST